MKRSIWMKYSTLLVVSLLLLQGLYVRAEDEPKKDEPKKDDPPTEPPKPTPHTNLTLGVPHHGKLKDTESITFEFHSNVAEKEHTRYSVYLPNITVVNFDYSASFVENVKGVALEIAEVALDRVVKRTEINHTYYLHQFEGKNGTYTFKLKHKKVGDEAHDHNYTIVVSKSTPFTSAPKRVLDTVGPTLIKSYDVKVEKPSSFVIDASLCIGEVELAVTDNKAKHHYDNQGKTGFLAGEFDVEEPGTVWIDVLHMTHPATTEPAEFKWKVTFKEVGYSRPDYWSDALKFISFNDKTNIAEFEKATFTATDKKYEEKDFTVKYKVVAGVSEKDVTRVLRCGPRTDEKNASIETIVPKNCTDKNTCFADVAKIVLPTENIFVGIIGGSKNNKTNETEKVTYDKMFTAKITPSSSGSGAGTTAANIVAGAKKIWIYLLVGFVAIMLIVAVLCWRRKQHMNLKMEEELAGGAYQKIDA